LNRELEKGLNVGRAMKETFEFGISVKGEQKRRQEVKGLAMNSFHMLTHVRIWSAASVDTPHLSLCWQQVTSQDCVATRRCAAH